MKDVVPGVLAGQASLASTLFCERVWCCMHALSFTCGHALSVVAHLTAAVTASQACQGRLVLAVESLITDVKLSKTTP
jgi:hypothetical protein